MAKPPPKKKTTPTKSRGAPTSRKPVKKPDTKTPPPCCSCEGHPSGTILVCEDGGCYALTPPTYYAVLTFDPNRPGGLPYWERPVNLGLNCPVEVVPVPEREELPPNRIVPVDTNDTVVAAVPCYTPCDAPCTVSCDAPCTGLDTAETPAVPPPPPEVTPEQATDNTPPAPVPEEAQGAP